MTMLDDMARAIEATNLISERGDMRATALAIARAALKAIRTPSMALIDEGMQHFTDPCWPENAARGFTAMIDAISEGEA